jgi:acyl transferase domain-containing protein/acyl carrier protein
MTDMTREAFQDVPLAVIGMSCRLPGADNLEEYWQLLRNGVSAISELPPDRFDAALYYHPKRGVTCKSYSKLGGIVAERPFDRAVCPVSEEAVASSDIAHITMLEVAAAGCRHAGLDPLNMPLRNTGVYIGHVRGSPLAGEMAYATHIEQIVEELRNSEAFAECAGNEGARIARAIIERVHQGKPRRREGGKPYLATHGVAALISDAFALSGPYTAVDAACASSLIALALAARALQDGQIDMAIVGGASYANWYSYVVFSQAHALSSVGSFPFDARADGFINSDGYAAVLLKTLSRAVADQDEIHGVIRGIGVSCDGRGRSLWAPRKEGQIEAIRRAYGERVDPGRLQYIEAHGTSTQLGDATEIEALAAALGDRLPEGARIPLASVKANIGHARETAGLAGLLKTLLAMRHGLIPPAINYETPNPHIPWGEIPFFVPTTLMDWPESPDGHPRRAAVEAFGIGGLNVHVVVDQWGVTSRAAVHGQGRDDDPGKERVLASSGRAGATGKGLVSASSGRVGEIAIIGLGAVFPGALTAGSYWELLASGRNAKSPVEPNRWDPAIFYAANGAGPWRSSSRIGGFITDFKYDWKKHRIPPKQVESADPLQFMLLEATDQALRDAGYDTKGYDRRRVGVIVGTIFGGDFSGHLNVALHLPELERDLREALKDAAIPDEQARRIVQDFPARFLEARPMVHDETGSYSSSTLASRIAKTFDFMGGAFAMDAGEASSLAALSAAVDLLRCGACDMVLCAGAQRAMDITVYESCAMRGWLSADGERAAFDAEANGFVPGEGVGMVLLKRLADARRDGDRIHAAILAIGAASAGSSPAGAFRTAIERALGRSGTSPTAVSIVEAAGTAIPVFDAEEADAVAAGYGGNLRERPVWLGSVIGQIGHTLGASGMASLLKVILALQHRQLPATVGLKNPAPSIVRHDEVLRALPKAVFIPPGSAEAPNMPLLAGVNAFAFRGLAYHALLSEVSPTSTASRRIIRLGASTVAELADRVARSRDQSESIYATGGRSVFASQDRARLAIVAETPASLAAKLSLAHEQMTRPEARSVLEEQGVFFSPRESEPRVAFLFPGQGSQYAGMLRELASEMPAVAAKLKELDGIMASLGYPGYSEIAWNSEAGLGNDVWVTQVSVLLADTLMYTALTSIGARADVVSGHSYGEYPALVAAGAWTLEQAIRATRIRCELIEASEKAQGVMVSTTASPEIVEELAAGIEGAVSVALHNAPDQTVIGGERRAVAELETRLTSQGYETRLLAVPRAFHTPLMTEVQAPLRRMLEQERIRPPQTPIMSSATNRYAAEPDEIRNNLVAQLTDRVRYVDLIQRLADEGVNVFVEVGPQQVLSRLNRRILAGRSVAIIACDQAKRHGIEQLDRVRALLECAGALDGRAGAESLGRAESPAPAGSRGARSEILHFDATVRRKNRLKRSAAQSQFPARREDSASAPESSDELESFLITFVCEQTGYPREVVELDADLEADLGIDSIKKAQLFGELRERFDLRIQLSEDFSLDDFPTLRHVLDFLRQLGTAAPPQAAGERPPVVRTRTLGDPNARPATDSGPHTVRTPDAAPPDNSLNVVHCAGTPYEIGLQHGRSQREPIMTALIKYWDMVGQRIGDTEGFHEVCAQMDSYFSTTGLEEFRGMADGLERPIEELVAYNLGLHFENAAGCAQFAITAGRNGRDGLIHGVNEDLPLGLLLPNCLTRIAQVRHPAKGIPHVIFTIAGQLGGLNGINARGLAVTSTLLADRYRKSSEEAGSIHPVLVKTVLEQAEDIEAAVEIVRAAKRSGAWSLCISHHPTDRLCYVEYDGPSFLIQPDQDFVATTNHCVLHPSPEVPQHSGYRLARLRGLLAANGDAAGCSLTLGQSVLRDRYDLGRARETAHPTMNTIRRVDNQISIIMRPAFGEVWATAGPAEHFHRLSLDELFVERPAKMPATVPQGGPAPQASGSLSDEEELLAAEDGRTMSRFVLRMFDAPLAESPNRRLRFQGPCLVLGSNTMADALRARLREIGATVLDLPVGDDPQETIAALNGAWTTQPAPHLFLMTAWDEDALARNGSGAWARRYHHGVIMPYLVCQHWTRLVLKSNVQRHATLTAATTLGGDFGFSSREVAIEGGGLAGLLKSVRREVDGMVVKIIDAPPEAAPQAVIEAICTELASSAAAVEVGYDRGRRRVVRAVPRPLLKPAARDIARGGTWIATGGASGITAIVARELGHRFGLKLHLLGRSSVPQIPDAWRSLSEDALKNLKLSLAQDARRAGRDPAAARRELEKALEIDHSLWTFGHAGVQATYHSCDVTDRAALSSVLTRIREADGPIHGIIHGAGVEAAARFDRKDLQSVRVTIASKVEGAMALMDLTREDPLAYFVGFASISGRFGGMGQTDYALASDMLCKLVQRFRAERPQCASVAIHWPAWDEAGMAVRPETKLALTIGKLRLMPPREGVEHLIDELRAGAPEGEVLIVDGRGSLDHDGILPTPAHRRAFLRRTKMIADLPLIDGLRELNEGQSLVAEAGFHPTSDPFLLDHRYQGVPLLPAVIGIESLAEAAVLLDGDRKSIRLRNVEILNGLRFYTDRQQNVAIRAIQNDIGASCELSGDFYDRHGKLIDSQRLFMRADVELADGCGVPTLASPREQPTEWHAMSYFDEARAKTERWVYLGPSLRCLQEIAIQGDCAWGRIVAPPLALPGGRRGEGWIIPPAVLDGCLVACAVYAKKKLKRYQLPHAFGQIRLGRLPEAGETCTVQVSFRGQQEKVLVYDFVLFGEDGAVILGAEGHRGIILSREMA